MSYFNISDEEKKKILEMHNSIDEQKLIWDDPANKKALEGYLDMGKPKRKFILDIQEPFIFETTDRNDFERMRFVLIKNRIKFEESEEKIEY